MRVLAAVAVLYIFKKQHWKQHWYLGSAGYSDKLANAVT